MVPRYSISVPEMGWNSSDSSASFKCLSENVAVSSLPRPPVAFIMVGPAYLPTIASSFPSFFSPGRSLDLCFRFKIPLFQGSISHVLDALSSSQWLLPELRTVQPLPERIKAVLSPTELSKDIFEWRSSAYEHHKHGGAYEGGKSGFVCILWTARRHECLPAHLHVLPHTTRTQMDYSSAIQLNPKPPQ